MAFNDPIYAEYGVYPPLELDGTPLAQVWLDAFLEYGSNSDLAWGAVRRAPDYDFYFPGNRREDGSPIHSEKEYLSILESYDVTLASIGLNPDVFRASYPQLIAGLVSPAEFTSRVEQVYQGIIDQAPAIMDYYTREFGIDMTEEAVVASFLNPDVGQQILAGDVAVSQVGGSAQQRGFGISRDFAQQLVHAGMDTTSEAAQFFSLAEGMLPVLSTLANRHLDPDDSFDLEEFTAAAVFNDPEQRARMRRLVAQEQGLFRQGGSGIGGIATTQSGRALGLEAR